MLKSLAECSVFSVKTEARAPRGDRRRAGRSLRLGRGPSGGRHARTANRSGQRVSPAASSNSCRRLASRARAVGIRTRRKRPECYLHARELLRDNRDCPLTCLWIIVQVRETACERSGWYHVVQCGCARLAQGAGRGTEPCKVRAARRLLSKAAHWPA